MVNKKRIPLNAQGFLHVFGIPAGDIDISMVDDAGKSEFLAFFGLTEVPTIKFFGSKIIQEELSDEQFIRCFMIVALSTVLCPTSNTKPSTKYMGSYHYLNATKQDLLVQTQHSHQQTSTVVLTICAFYVFLSLPMHL